MSSSPDIPGLLVIPDYVDADTERDLLAAVDAEPWREDLTRRVQHYGWVYDYRKRKVDPSMYLGPLPDWSLPLAERLVTDGHMQEPEQLIVNEYEPGQGISSHVDSPESFGPVVISLCLGSGCIMQFAHPDHERQEAWLPARTLVVLSGPARDEWAHAIPGRKSDVVGGLKWPRGRRVSLTFRTIRR